MLTMKQKRALSWVVRNRYQKSSKKEKGRILNEFLANTGYNRSYARRILGSLKKLGRKRRYSPRKRVYDISVFYPLRKVWIAADGICGKRLKPFIPELMKVLEKNKELKLNQKLRKKLITASSTTIDRMLAGTRKQYQLKGRSTTKPGTLLRSIIPVKTFSDWNEEKPGFMEADLVPCAEKLLGENISTLLI